MSSHSVTVNGIVSTIPMCKVFRIEPQSGHVFRSGSLGFWSNSMPHSLHRMLSVKSDMALLSINMNLLGSYEEPLLADSVEKVGLGFTAVHYNPKLWLGRQRM